MPAIEAPDTTATMNVIGIDRRKPDSSLMLRVPVRTSTSPTTMNSAALNTACATRIEMAAKVALGVPIASNVISSPSCDTVPQARISLASTCRSAPMAPHSMVTSPKARPSGFHTSVSWNAGAITATRITPALTMVAECR